MESWQIRHIVRNQLRLTEITAPCVKQLAEQLQDAGMLSPEEVAEIDNIQVARLYGYLYSRKDSYKALVQAYKGIFEMEAADILNNHAEWHKEFRGFKLHEDNVLGWGHFGTTVYAAEHLEKAVAVKVIPKRPPKWDTIVSYGISGLLKISRHENIVRYFTVEEDANVTYIVMEKCDINLPKEMKCNIVDMDVVDIMRKCAQGLHHLHSHHVIHGNLKPNNVLLTIAKEVKISDFGMLGIPRGHRSPADVIDLKDWLPPETLQCLNLDPATSFTPPMSFQADVFALGCLFFFTLTKGGHPFGKGPCIQENINNDKPKLQDLQSKRKWRSLIKIMISKNPLERPFTPEILQHKLLLPGRKMVPKDRQDLNKRWSTSTVPDDSSNSDTEVFQPERRSILPPDSDMSLVGRIDNISSIAHSDRSAIFQLSSNSAYDEAFCSGPLHSTKLVAPDNSKNKRKKRSRGDKKKFDVFIHNVSSDDEIPTENAALRKTTWKRSHLNRFSDRLAETTVFREEFFQKLRHENIMSEFYYKKCMYLIKQKESDKIFCLPFARDEFYDHLLAECKETDQSYVYSLLERGYKLVEKWSYSEAVYHITNFDLLKEAITYNCDISMLHQLHNSEAYKFLLFNADDNGSNLLHVAAKIGRIDVVDYLLTLAFNANTKNNFGKTPLHYVYGAEGDVITLTRLMLEYQADPTVRDSHGQTAAHQLSLNLLPHEYHDWVKYMVEEGHKGMFAQADPYGDTPLHYTARHREVSEALLNLHALLHYDFNGGNNVGSTVIMRAAKGGQCKAVLQRIAELGGDMSKKDHDGRSVLHYSVMSSSVEAVQYFFQMGHIPNEEDIFSLMPLHYLDNTDVNSIEIMELLNH